jgi:hypothetical protein
LWAGGLSAADLGDARQAGKQLPRAFDRPLVLAGGEARQAKRGLLDLTRERVAVLLRRERDESESRQNREQSKRELPRPEPRRGRSRNRRRGHERQCTFRPEPLETSTEPVVRSSAPSNGTTT